MNKSRNIIVTGIIIALFSCQYLNQLKSDKAQTEKIESEFYKNQDLIDISKLNDFKWDNLIILGSYSIIEQIEIEQNLDLENIRQNIIKSSDSINLIIFLKDGKSIKICELSRKIGDFKNLAQIIKKDKAQFFKNKNGQIVLLE